MSGSNSFLVVVDDFDAISRSILPYETDSILVIDADAVLALPVTLECLQPISGVRVQIFQASCRLQVQKFPLCNAGDSFESLNADTHRHLFGFFVPVGGDHITSILHGSYNAKGDGLLGC